MKLTILHIVVGFLYIVGMLSSCAEDVSLEQSNDKGTGSVIFSYSVAGNGIGTRASTNGWNAPWNENTITRLDLFIFEQNGTYRNHIPKTDNVQSPTDNTTYCKWENTGLLPSDIENAKLYLIANCPSLEGLTDIDLTDLQEKTVGELTSTGLKTFVMDAVGQIPEENSDNEVVVNFDLKRAAAKICISLNTQSWNNVEFRLCHYTKSSTVLALDEDAEDTYLETLVPEYYPSANTMELVKNANLYDDLDDSPDAGKQLILYSYANNWFKSPTPDEGYTSPDVDGGETTMEDDQLYKQEPIDEGKQTYVLLLAPYGDDGKRYYYKIPVNYRLPENNDDINPDPEKYKHLYRLQRNYIYDITVTIDKEGGPEEKEAKIPTIKWKVMDYEEEAIDVPVFK